MSEIFICSTDSLSENKPFVFNLSPDEQIVIFQTSKGYYAIGNRCPHAGALLHEGLVEGTVLTCAWHGWKFDLESGQCLTEYWATVQTYPLEVKENKIFLKRSGKINADERERKE
ncbi:MAG: Rieske (2Fe-2S) protein [Calditrichia bacterium]